MGGDHFMDNIENPSVDNNKGPRLVAMELILFVEDNKTHSMDSNGNPCETKRGQKGTKCEQSFKKTL